MNKMLLLSLSVVAGLSALSTSAGATPPVGTISTFGPSLAGTPCSNPEGIALDSQGNFYTGSDRDGDTVGTVCVFSPTGALTGTIPVPAGDGGVVALLGLLFEGPHTLFALDIADGGSTNGRLLAIDTQSHVVTPLATGFTFPNGIAEDSNENLFVSDSVAGTITRIAQDGSHRTLWASNALLASAGFPPLGANGIAFDASARNLYVANTGDDRVLRIPVLNNGNAGAVQIFADGPTINQRQHTNNALDGADGIAFDVDGNLYVAANQFDEIQVLSPNGRLIARYPGTETPPIDFPASLIFKGNQLYFTNASLFDDGVNSRILVLQAPRPGLPVR